MKTRTLKKCKKCGALNMWNERKNYCYKCKNTTYKEIEFRDFTKEEQEAIDRCKKMLLYILDFSFDKIKPSKDKYFGCIEMCDYLNKEYDLQFDSEYDVYELVGMVSKLISSLEHAEYIPEFGTLMSGQTEMALDDGRYFSYKLVYYSPKIVNERSAYDKCSEEDIRAIKLDTKKELQYIIKTIAELKPCTTGREDFDYPCPDYDFDLADAQKVRTKVVGIVKPQIDRKKVNEFRNRMVEEVTKPIENTDPNYVKEATCPNCHKNSVYRISNVKRGASIGLFGLFSKNIGKTMECRSCGYKW